MRRCWRRSAWRTSNMCPLPKTRDAWFRTLDVGKGLSPRPNMPNWSGSCALIPRLPPFSMVRRSDWKLVIRAWWIPLSKALNEVMKNLAVWTQESLNRLQKMITTTTIAVVMWVALSTSTATNRTLSTRSTANDKHQHLRWRWLKAAWTSIIMLTINNNSSISSRNSLWLFRQWEAKQRMHWRTSFCLNRRVDKTLKCSTIGKSWSRNKTI